MDTLEVVGVFEGDDFVGEIDLARSEVVATESVYMSYHMALCRKQHNSPTSTASLPFFSTL